MTGWYTEERSICFCYIIIKNAEAVLVEMESRNRQQKRIGLLPTAATLAI